MWRVTDSHPTQQQWEWQSGAEHLEDDRLTFYTTAMGMAGHLEGDRLTFYTTAMGVAVRTEGNRLTNYSNGNHSQEPNT